MRCQYFKKNRIKFIFFLNVAVLMFNLFLLINRIFIQNPFKNSDCYNINLSKHSFYKISNILNNKYNVDINNNKIKDSKPSKKVIKIKTIGHYNESEHYIWLKQKLDNQFLLNIDDKNPDYLISNVYNDDDIKLNYKKINSVRIAIYTENVMPDLNYVDYAIAPYHINYFDRFFKCSTFFKQNFDSIDKIREKIIKNQIRKKFCAAVISNCNSIFRLDFIDELSKYKKVDMGGHCRNNINNIIKNKIEFLSNYKFSIAMENSRGDGYISEKIIDSLRAGTIPIYYGDFVIDEFINPKTYILINGKKDFFEKIEYIKKIDNDDNLYNSIMKEKPIIDNEFKNKIYLKEIKSFLKNIFKQDKIKAFRRDDNYYDFHCKRNTT